MVECGVQKLALDLQSSADVIEITSDTHFTGVYIGRQTDSLKRKLTFVHKFPNLTSRVDIKAVVFDQSQFDVEAKLVINKGAVNTDSYLSMKTLIVDAGAAARAVPSLEIKTDNVKAGHGATIGKINEEQLHYLQSRGFDRKTAQQEIISAFIGE